MPRVLAKSLAATGSPNPAKRGVFCARNIAPCPAGRVSLQTYRGPCTAQRGPCPLPPAPGAVGRGGRTKCQGPPPAQPAPLLGSAARGPWLGTRGARPAIGSTAPCIATPAPRITQRGTRGQNGIKVHVFHKQYCEKTISIF